MRNVRAGDGRWLLVAAMTLAATLAVDVEPVAAFDLSGTWTGKIACKGTLAGASSRDRDGVGADVGGRAAALLTDVVSIDIYRLMSVDLELAPTYA